MEEIGDPTANVESEHHNRVGASGVSKLVKSQPVLALSGLGVALGSMKRVLCKISRAAPSLRSLGLPKLPHFLPKYMRSNSLKKYVRSNYVKYPAIFLILLATVRRVRSSIGH